MKLLKQCPTILLILFLLFGCGTARPADFSVSSENSTASEAAPEMMENYIDDLMNHYIIPYEYFSLGQNWDYEDPNYVWPYDPDDIFSRQISIDDPVEGFALSVIVRKLPESERKNYVASETNRGTSYNVTAPLLDAVSRFYFGTPVLDPHDSLHVEDEFKSGLPELISENEGLTVAFNQIETLDNGDIRVVIDRALDGRPILSCSYTLRPFAVEEIPAELSGVFESGDRAYRFIKVEDILYEAEIKTIEIKTAEDLRELSRVANSGDAAYLRTTYLLMNDIDMQGESLEPIGQFSTRNTHDPNSNGFNSIFDGQGNTVSNLKIHTVMDNPEKSYNTGLFAVIGRYGQVKNLRIENCDISFDTGEREWPSNNATGGLAGTSYGMVSNCGVSGKIAGHYQVGGLIGASGWHSTVDSCSANTYVTGEAEIGAFIGTLHNALITNCTAEGEIISANLSGGYDRPRGIGGFSGFMVMGTVRDCSSSVFVKINDSADWVGGFTGYNQGEIINCLYDKNKTANWEAVDVVYQNAISDVRAIAEIEPDAS